MFEGTHTFVVKTFQGLENVLSAELRDLGLENIQTGHRMVSFESDFMGMYRANYWCRCALSILWPIKKDRVRDENQLYESVLKIPWTKYFSFNKTILIRSTVNSRVFTHSHYVSQKTKDAIADHFRRKAGKRPSVEKRYPDVVIDVHIRDTELTISLNSSGAPLFKRDYRRETVVAPINEVLAAGIILLSGWDKKTTLIDPMSGSGTFAIEASFLASNRSAQHIRGDFSFEHWHRYERSDFDKVRNMEVAEDAPLPNIYSSDIDGEAVRIGRKNARFAGIGREVKFKQQDFFSLENPGGSNILFFNPPYDKRLTEGDIELMYEKIGDRLKQEWSGSEAWIFSSHLEALKKIGLRTSRRIPLFNGPLEGKLCKFEMYDGRK